MPRFEGEWKLPSHFAEKSLLEYIEAYILERAASILSTADEPFDLSEHYTFNIGYKNSSERYLRIKDFPRTYFPNDTQSIVMEFYMVYPRFLKIKLGLSEESWSRHLEIAFDGDNAREVCQGIASEVFRAINDHKNFNHIFHRDMYLALILIISSLGFSWTWWNSSWVQEIIAIYVAAILGVMGYTTLGHRYKPIITFDTLSARQISKKVNWFFYAFLAFLIFGVLGTFLRRLLFGF